MAFDIFSTATLLEAVEQIPSPKTFLRSTFFNNVRTFDTKKVMIDLYKGGRRIAGFVNPNLPGKAVARIGYQTNEYEPPKIEPIFPTAAEELLKRLYGENPFGAMSPQERAMEQLLRDYVEQDNMITRREEQMCAQALFTGKINCVDKDSGVNEVFDFGMTPVKVDKTWDKDDSTPYDDIRLWKLQIQMKTGIRPNVLILSTDAGAAFANNAQIQAIVGKFRDLRLELNPRVIDEAVTFLCVLPELGLEVYTYDEWYYDEESKKNLPMIPQGYACMTSTNVNFDMLYGANAAIIAEQMAIIAATRLPRSWSENNPPVRYIATQSHPLPVPKMIDAVVGCQVLPKTTLEKYEKAILGGEYSKTIDDAAENVGERAGK